MRECVMIEICPNWNPYLKLSCFSAKITKPYAVCQQTGCLFVYNLNFARVCPTFSEYIHHFQKPFPRLREHGIKCTCIRYLFIVTCLDSTGMGGQTVYTEVPDSLIHICSQFLR